MKKNIFKALTISILTLPLLAFSGQKMIIAGQGWSEVGIIDKDSGEIEWAYTPQAPKAEQAEKAAKNTKAAKNAKGKKTKGGANKHGVSVNCVSATKEGNIAFSTSFSAMVVNKDKEVLWQYDAKPNQEIHSVAQLENGNYLVGACGIPSVIMEIDQDKNIVNQISFDAENSNIHSQFRHVTKLKNGNYLIALLKTIKLIEITPDGKVYDTYPMKGVMPSAIFGAYELKNGNIIVSGEAGHIIEYDKQNKGVVRTINNDNLKGANLLFACHVVELENGNLLVANWNGHSKDKTQPKLLEINKDNEVVWKLENSDRIKNLASVCLINE